MSHTHDHLEVPRLLYKGPDDQGAVAPPRTATPMDQVLATAQETDRLANAELARREVKTETCRVETHEALEEKLADGWRLHRTLDKKEAAATDAAVKADADAKQAEAKADADAEAKKAAALAAAAKKAKS